ncbi:bifunctional tRNA pseudouridine(32) synthase/23S rRNA pseudouridine(746) synthase RluA [Thalassotalea sp. PS06]|uniref:bifunctional tRNA pseudouridine(32) synthase/23S rRNA pseudouridine(746) synthase RluA n=1 Tax=Thalassotalea sp. PS06 TaxID=2594005 RepID=UPI001163A5DE|nr:bifunctional tRNA pseudouridine(32) synthase/23S rRNA pseudouridine(746) synthase RluA [Thalassotalea sp. PS06]QDP02216.1 bifunctional tRNA pseudouridine(32) synthase/23S rRNA pseudouridine(746) synthase RluA [Thalassotalea sp. PS06]
MSANPDFVYKPPMTPYLDILYRDDDLLIVNKPSGLLTVPGRLPEHQDCLQHRVQRVLPTATIVHRLDMATSGVMVMALNKPSHVAISRQFEKRQTEKYYLARVFGSVKKDTGEIDLPLICDWPNRPKQMVDHERGKKAITGYQVLEREPQTTLVKLMPVTGRSHQLRVHMLSLGHPIIGDRLYAHPQALALSPRLQLHAKALTLFHPHSGEKMTFETEPTF